MGLEIDRDHFEDEDFVRFSRRLRDCLAALRSMLARRGFGEGPASIGAELELDLVDAAGRPALLNREVLAGTRDPRITLEIDRFNLEINSNPLPLTGSCFSALEDALRADLAEIQRVATPLGARVATIGILPTLTKADLGASVLTDGNRTRALSAGLRRLRHEPFVFSIAGEDSLDVTSHDVAFEGANTSFQVHLRVAPAAFAATYNAAQLAIAPVLALAANSPLFLGQRLWDETRIALFRQAVDDRPEAEEDDWRSARVSFGHGWVRSSAYELFAESVVQHEPLLPVLGPEDPLEIAARGGTPTLAELRLHHGTVWRWNRAVYDAAGGGHLRIEMRALPSGPTPADMIANAVLAVGLTLALQDDVDDLLSGITFGQARRNFYAAARHGARAELLWPDAPGEPARPVAVGALVTRLLPQVEAALVRAGVAASEAARYLGIIGARARSGQTGAAWQRRMFAHAGGPVERERATKEVLSRYLAHAADGQPVHTWNLP